MSMSASMHGDDSDPFKSDWQDDSESARAAEGREPERSEPVTTTAAGAQGSEGAEAMHEQVSQRSQMEQPNTAHEQQQQQTQPQPRRPTRPALRDNPNWKEEIKIVDAQKTSEGAASSYISYVIRSDQGDARHRYSEFESLSQVLAKLYPVLIIPPIPPHHSLADYASKQGKAKEDANVIARRKRMLTIFLNRCGRHPILGEERVFRRFLEPNLPWSEVLHSPPVTLLPKNILKASARTPADPSTSALYSSLPGPSTSTAGSASGFGPALQEPDQRFLDSEIFTNKFSSHLSGSMEKVNRRLMKRWSELSADYAELGAVMNGFSLNEGGTSSATSAIANMQGEQERNAVESLSRAIESTGQAIDSTYLNSNALLQDWERTFTEPLAEYSQFSSVIKQLLKYRHNKHLQFEMTRDTLETKKSTLEELERSEMEARRLDQALDRALSRVKPLDNAGEVDSSSPDHHAEGANQPTNTQEAGPSGSSSLSASQTMRKSGSSKFGFLGALSHTINGMVDADPDTTRRNNIGKTRETITQLEGSIHSITSDLRYANQMIQADLDRFQRQKVSDFREMCLSFSNIHRDWCKKNLEMWEEAKKAIDEIDDAPAPLAPARSQPSGAD